jgi:hypothetical protein
MNAKLESWANQVRVLDAALGELVPMAERLGVPSPDRAEDPRAREWYELLAHKLRPQLEATPYLVVAVVGGTNIGKSLIFNHLAGEDASGVSPLAAGTKQPVCLCPPGFDDEATLGRMFDRFALSPWQSSDDPLSEDANDILFWRVGRNVPANLLLLDTPDIDSDRQVNWQRADGVRHVADVLIAVLTQQKYNDAAVKQFFRKVAEADKPVIVIFNQCELNDDRAYWPHWLATFTGETGAAPELVYVAPYDRAAAKRRELPFYEVGPQGTDAPQGPVQLRDELANLRFDEIKIRTFRGAVAKVLDRDYGAPAYLRRIRRTSGEYAAALGALSTTEMARVDWPALPPQLLVEEIRVWWNSHRSEWARRVHGFYRAVGRGVTWPVRTAWSAINPPPVDPLEDFRRRERHAIVLAVQNLLDELKRLSEVGNETLRPRLAKLLKGEARAELLAHVEAAHAQLAAVDEHYRAFLRAELDVWSRENPRAVSFLRSLDHVFAIARPAVTVSLAVSGWIVAGGIVHEAALHAATHTATEIATEAALTGGITGGGEALVDATSSRLRLAAAKMFGRLQAKYAEQRAQWLATWLEQELLGDLLRELQQGAEVPSSAPFHAVERAVQELARPQLAVASA